MPDYSKSKIYKIVDKTNNNIYIGSTTLELKKRLNNHVSSYNFHMNGKGGFTSSYDIIKNNNFIIELIELYPCNNKDELCQKENVYLNTLDCINRNKSFRSVEDINNQYKKNIEKLSKWVKLDRQNNPEKHMIYKENRKIKIECKICQRCVSKANMSRHIREQHP